MEEYDVVIVGGGPAGLTAGLYSARARMKSVLIEKKALGGQLLNTEWIEDYPGFDLIKGVELAQRMEEQVRKLGLEIESDGVKCIKHRGHLKLVQMESGREFLTKTAIVTSGGEPRRLAVPGEREFAGRGVSYCAICDGAFFQGQEIAVVGGGDAAMEEAMFLTRFASKVHILHRRAAFRAQSLLLDRAKRNPKIQIHRNTMVDSIHGTDAVDYIMLRRGDQKERLDVTGLFVFIGFIPNTELFCGHVDRDAYGYVTTDSNMATSVSGIYAAGDIRSQITHQITTAVGDGTTAAIAAQRFIEHMPERLEVAWSA